MLQREMDIGFESPFITWNGLYLREDNIPGSLQGVNSLQLPILWHTNVSVYKLVAKRHSSHKLTIENLSLCNAVIAKLHPTLKAEPYSLSLIITLVLLYGIG